MEEENLPELHRDKIIAMLRQTGKPQLAQMHLLEMADQLGMLETKGIKDEMFIRDSLDPLLTHLRGGIPHGNILILGHPRHHGHSFITSLLKEGGKYHVDLETDWEHAFKPMSKDPKDFIVIDSLSQLVSDPLADIDFGEPADIQDNPLLKQVENRTKLSKKGRSPYGPQKGRQRGF